MGKGAKGDGDDKEKKRKQLACAACTAILVGILVLIAVLYFAVYQPKDPKVQVPTMQLLALKPSYSSASLGGGGGYNSKKQQQKQGIVSSVNVTLSLQVSIYNPNRGSFIVEEGGIACLYYKGSQLGFTPVPPGSVPAQAFSAVSIPLTVQGPAPLSLSSDSDSNSDSDSDSQGNILQLVTAVTIVGRVTTLNLFTHHSNIVSKCFVNVSLDARGIMAYTCQRSFPLLDP